ncbi:MAG: YbaB/EbfC family nucleoid-associated protein [Kiritimatiellales bacterium]|nr:YbaB/EbfC family nucleoid-associated protein [Kiritimatiellales bacterium]
MDMMKMMKQVSEMKKIQKQLAAKKVEFSSAAGQVTVKMSCDMKPHSVTIAPELIAAGNVKKIESAILDAFKGVLNEAQEATAKDMKSLTASLGLPFGK